MTPTGPVFFFCKLLLNGASQALWIQSSLPTFKLPHFLTPWSVTPPAVCPCRFFMLIFYAFYAYTILFHICSKVVPRKKVRFKKKRKRKRDQEKKLGNQDLIHLDQANVQEKEKVLRSYFCSFINSDLSCSNFSIPSGTPSLSHILFRHTCSIVHMFLAFTASIVNPDPVVLSLWGRGQVLRQRLSDLRCRQGIVEKRIQCRVWIWSLLLFLPHKFRGNIISTAGGFLFVLLNFELNL